MLNKLIMFLLLIFVLSFSSYGFINTKNLLHDFNLSNQTAFNMSDIYNHYYNLSYIDYKDFGSVDDGISISYRYYFQGVNNISVIPKELQTFFSRSSLLDISYSSVSGKSYESNTFNIELGGYFGEKKSIGFFLLYKFQETDYERYRRVFIGGNWVNSYENINRRDSSFGLKNITYFRPNIRLNVFYIAGERKDRPRYSNPHEFPREHYEIYDISLEYLLGVSYKFTLGNYEIDWDYRGDYSHTYYGLTWFPNTSYSLSINFNSEDNHHYIFSYNHSDRLSLSIRFEGYDFGGDILILGLDFRN